MIAVAVVSRGRTWRSLKK